MPFLDWVNKAQAQRTTAAFRCHLPQFLPAHGESQSIQLIASVHGR
jgi:hypothetical protein